MFCHSVYGVGLNKPKQVGIRDMMQTDFNPNELTYDKPNAVFVNTGKMSTNRDLDELPAG